MATHFLITCPQGHEIVAEAGQAGDRIHCECGAEVAVPKLGELRLRPRVEPAEASRAKPAWTVRHGLITVAGLVATGSLLLGIYFWATTPTSNDFNMADQFARAEATVDALTPAETWLYWHTWTAPIGRLGLEQTTTPQAVEFDRQVGEGTIYQKFAFGTAGFAALISIAVALLSPSKQKRL